MMLSVVILTKNEAKRIVDCIHSARFADETIVIDSGSTDNTIALAQSAGAKVFSYPDWQGFAMQRNRGLQHVSADYVFFLDADEIITPELRESIQKICRNQEQVVGKIRWLTVAYGKSLTHISQGEIERLFPVAQLLRYEGVVHEAAVLKKPDIPRVVLQGKLVHYSRETIKASLQKLTQYAMLGAAKRAEKGKRGGVIRGLGSGTAIFIRLYFFRLGILGGAQGFLFCFFIALECFFRYVALKYDRQELKVTIGR